MCPPYRTADTTRLQGNCFKMNIINQGFQQALFPQLDNSKREFNRFLFHLSLLPSSPLLILVACAANIFRRTREKFQVHN